MAKNGLTSEQLMLILDSLQEIVCIIDLESYEVLFANKVTEELLGFDPVGKTCYSVLQGKEEPCSFCSNDIIIKNTEKPYIWEQYNPVLDRHYKYIDQAIKWSDGNLVKLELTIDITEDKLEVERRLEEKQLFDNVKALRRTVRELKEGKNENECDNCGKHGCQRDS
jgi:hypothetical protein